jgi:hypothetical protein
VVVPNFSRSRAESRPSGVDLAAALELAADLLGRSNRDDAASVDGNCAIVEDGVLFVHRQDRPAGNE